MSEIVGHISQVIGPVVDVAFEAVGNDVQLPAINEALSVTRPDGRELIIEVQQHIGENSVRCVAMDSTDGLRRGLEAKATGAPITMPVGDQVKGRLLNVIGQPIDHLENLKEGARRACCYSLYPG